MTPSDTASIQSLLSEGKLLEARSALTAVLAAKSDDMDAVQLLATIDIEQDQIERAAVALQRVIEALPDSAAAHYNLGLCRMRQGNMQQAYSMFRGALSLDPGQTKARFNVAYLMSLTGHVEEACKEFELVVKQQPDWLQGQQAYCETLIAAGRPLDASNACTVVVRRGIANAAIYRIRGDAFRLLNRLFEAEDNYRAALKADPRDIDAHVNLAGTLQLANKSEDALPIYERALLIAGHAAHGKAIFGTILSDAILLCRRVGDVDRLRLFEEQAQQVSKDSNATLRPDVAQSVLDDPVLLKSTADAHFAAIQLPVPLLLPAHTPDGKIRVGILSDKFIQNQMTHLLRGVFSRFDRSKFEIHGYSVGEFEASTARRNFKNILDAFTDLGAHSDEQAARDIAGHGIDVLINATRGLPGSVLGILSRKPAPVIVSFQSLPGTLGLRSIDYLIADDDLVKEGEDAFYSESILRIGSGISVLVESEEIAPPVRSRADLQLPDGKFIFCSPASSDQLTARSISIFADILRKAPESVLWFNQALFGVRLHLRAAFQKLGVNEDRIVFMKGVAYQEHLERLKHADLVLTPVPGGANEAVQESLIAGVPAIARFGSTFSSRQSAAYLLAAGLPRFVASSDETFVDIAVNCAKDKAQLAAARDVLKAGRSKSKLFGVDELSKCLQDALSAVVDRQRSGSAPTRLRF